MASGQRAFSFDLILISDGSLIECSRRWVGDFATELALAATGVCLARRCAAEVAKFRLLLPWLAAEMATTTRQIGWRRHWPTGTRPLRPESSLIYGVCFFFSSTSSSSLLEQLQFVIFVVVVVAATFKQTNKTKTIQEEIEEALRVIRPGWPTDRSDVAAGLARGKWTRWGWPQPEAHVASLMVSFASFFSLSSSRHCSCT